MFRPLVLMQSGLKYAALTAASLGHTTESGRSTMQHTAPPLARATQPSTSLSPEFVTSLRNEQRGTVHIAQGAWVNHLRHLQERTSHY
jgi:hypothetical protein